MGWGGGIRHAIPFVPGTKQGWLGFNNPPSLCGKVHAYIVQAVPFGVSHGCTLFLEGLIPPTTRFTIVGPEEKDKTLAPFDRTVPSALDRRLGHVEAGSGNVQVTTKKSCGSQPQMCVSLCIARWMAPTSKCAAFVCTTWLVVCGTPRKVIDPPHPLLGGAVVQWRRTPIPPDERPST